eukprot:TRINITY_DN43347_c0_g1_i1.p1 TRINITY_DN43347_c0_g1~~TRINITY_DN43347_c0_g1_i1.p1  ORF type:complete len:128 (-),score=45.54 TRINITY_DN43347_c0_g1_i1:200-583(-)
MTQMIVYFFFFKQKTAYEMLRSLVGSEMCIRDSCKGPGGNIGSCIPSEEGQYKKEVYMCDDAGDLLISRCTDSACHKCSAPRKDNYGYDLPANRDLEQIGCKSDFLKAICTSRKLGSIFVHWQKDEF